MWVLAPELQMSEALQSARAPPAPGPALNGEAKSGSTSARLGRDFGGVLLVLEYYHR